jgi:ATP-dependent Clp protease ATP-binding subunit ClpB
MADQGVIRLEKFAADAKQLVASAQELADQRGHAEVLPLHLLARGLERHPGIAAVLRSAGADPLVAAEQCERALAKLAKAGGGVSYVSPRLLDLLERAEREAVRDGAAEVGVAQLLHAMAQEIRGAVGDILTGFGIGPGGFRDHVGELDRAPKAPAAVAPKPAAAGELALDLVAAARLEPFGPAIGRDAEVRRLLQILERRAKNHPLVVGEPGVGKTTLVRALARRVASGDVPSNLAGARLWELDTGALVAGAKLRGELEARLKAVVDRLVASSASEAILVVEELHSLFAGGVTGSGIGELLRPLLARGDLRILATATPDGVQKIEERDGSIVRRFTSFVLEPASPELAFQILRGVAPRFERHQHLQIAEGAIRSAVTLAKRYLGDRALPDSAVDLLDETAARKRVEVDGVPVEADQAMRRLEALEAQLAGVADDPTELGGKIRAELEAEAASLRPKVAELRSGLEARRGVVAALQMLRREEEQAKAEHAAANSAKNFARVGELEHVVLPGLAARLAAAEESAKKGGARSGPVVVDENDVAVTLNEWTGIPVAKMLEGEAEKLLKMEERLAEQVIGQDEACAAVSRAVRRGRVGLRDPGKPIGSFLFLGPSGVGKTYFAKKLAEFLFDHEQALTRLDMSEFMEKHMAQRLIGSPPGYADSEQGGFLTEAVRRRPYSVLLFDEVEKAHADVFNLLLQLLDDGRLTDGRGRTADFSNTVVVMTSNIGSKRILECDPKLFETPDGREALRDVVHTELNAFFRPELLNRIDDIVVFKGLQKKDLRGIVEGELRKIGKMLAERDMSLTVSDAAKDRLVELGYEPALGARPLKRAIMRELQNPLAQAILEGGALAFGKVAVDAGPEGLVFRQVT